MGCTVKIEKIVGLNMAGVRGRQGWSQPEFGKMLGTIPGVKPWSRQAVSNAENGQRAFTAADLVAIACVLETSPAALLTLRPEAHTVELGDAPIPREQLENPTWTHESTSEALADVLRAVRTVTSGLDQIMDVAQPLVALGDELSAAGGRLQARIRLEEAGASKPGDYGYE
jgi:transcriptional regulator with XRE-family HTH domain